VRQSCAGCCGLLLASLATPSQTFAQAADTGAEPIDKIVADSGPDYGEHAADHHYDPATMAATRASVRHMHGGASAWMFLAERFELSSDNEFIWEAEGWYGGRINRLWLKTDGDADLENGDVGSAELQTLYSRAIRPHWDLQLGLRHNFEPTPTRNHAVIGLKGLAPYLFEIDGALFLSEKGDLSGRLEAEYEFRLSQRLFLQPRAEFDFALSDDESVGVGSGLNELELGLRLRYEFRKDFAPYLGYQWSRKYGRTAELADEQSTSGAVLGLRIWL